MYRNSILNLKTWMLAHYKVLLLSFMLCCLTFPNYTLTYFPGIDGPLPWVFNYFADGHYQLGQGILFPHGPLAFMLYPLTMGNNLIVTVLFTFVFSFLFCCTFFKIYFTGHKESYLLPILLLFILLSITDLQLVLIGLTVGQLILHTHSQKPQQLVIAVLATVLNLYLKTYGGIICILVLLSYFVHQSFIKKDFKKVFYLPVLFFVFFYLVWLGLYQSFSGSLNFLIGQVQLSSDNSEAVSFYQVNNWYFIGLSLLSFILIPFFTKDKTTRLVHGLLLLPLFGAWKHAMSRADSIHVSGFLVILILFSLLILLVENEKKFAGFLLCIVSVSGFALNMLVTAQYNDYTLNKELDLAKPYKLFNLLFNYDSLKKEKLNVSAQNNATEKLPDTLLKIIRGNSIDVFPWNYAIVAVNKLNWQPRPSLHSYASYTSWLDEQNDKHILSGNSAKFMLWELDELGGKLNGIDYRYLLNDAPRTMLSFFSNYHLRFKNSRYILYEKQAKATEFSTTVCPEKRIAYNTWVDVPDPLGNSITRAKIKIRKSFGGFMKSIFYKGESYSVHYQTKDGKTYSHKIVPKNAGDGLWINPLILQPETDQIESQVKKIKIVCWGESSVTKDFDLEFEQIKFEGAVDFLKRCFNKQDTLK